MTKISRGIPLTACITLDLESDGFWNKDIFCELLENEQWLAQFKGVFLTHGIKLTCFVTGKLIEERPDYIDKISQLDAEFELHSYSHNHLNPDSAEEIQKGSAAYEKHFARKPRGYRAPIGLISDEGMSRLAAAGFRYDSSVMPTFRPDEYGYNRLGQPTLPHLHASGLLEIPMSVIPGIRLPLTLSFMKLFGPTFYKILFGIFGLPPLIVFDSHPYDYFPTRAQATRKDWKRCAHARNAAQAIHIFRNFVINLENRGYRFAFMSELADRYSQGVAK